MNTNILIAIKNLLEYNDNKILEIYSGIPNNRANNMGDALEYFIKDLFCSSLNVNFNEKDEIYSKYLSYLGNKNNPPDFIIKNSFAIEVKKIEKLNFGDIALNSSYPKNYLYSTSKLISDSCRHCEDEFGGWDKKNMIYTIGNVVDNYLRLLWFIEGSCYCACEKVYKRIRDSIKYGVNNINGVEFADTNELGRVKKVDPLGITDLRIRGMWSIKHPMKVFDYLVDDYNKNVEIQMYCLLSKNTYDGIDNYSKDCLAKYINNGKLLIEDVNIKDPNNPAKFLEAVLFKTNL